MKLNELLAQLHGAGIQAVVLAMGTGKIVVTPHGGRVLGCFTHEGGENVFWVNPELASAESAKKWLAGEHVLGGDRLWIAPERGLFFHGDKLADGVSTQKGIDPGNWVVGRLTDHSVRLTNEFSATYLRTPNSRVSGIVRRSIRRIASSGVPCSRMRFPRTVTVNYAGYEIASEFELLESPHDELHFGMSVLDSACGAGGRVLVCPDGGAGGDYSRRLLRSNRPGLSENHRHARALQAGLDQPPQDRHPENRSARPRPLPEQSGHQRARRPWWFATSSAITSPVITPMCHCTRPRGSMNCIQSYNHNTGPTGFGELEYQYPRRASVRAISWSRWSRM